MSLDRFLLQIVTIYDRLLSHLLYKLDLRICTAICTTTGGADGDAYPQVGLAN